MCGFAGFFSAGRRFAPSLLTGAAQDLAHRGPDSSGLHEEPGCALVFRRLSIIDNRPVADQPMVDGATGARIVFNGEIYNHAKLREQLTDLGHTFHTTSDTETILVGYRQWGQGVIDKLEGMYAFIIVDPTEGIAIAARDPFGIKPLYLVETKDCIGLASEVRPLLRLKEASPDLDTILELLVYGFAAGSNSNLSGIERVPGGTVVENRRGGAAPDRVRPAGAARPAGRDLLGRCGDQN
jgi:asparagine synthase (glutamine-hydrolysing)